MNARISSGRMQWAGVLHFNFKRIAIIVVRFEIDMIMAMGLLSLPSVQFPFFFFFPWQRGIRVKVGVWDVDLGHEPNSVDFYSRNFAIRPDINLDEAPIFRYTLTGEGYTE